MKSNKKLQWLGKKRGDRRTGSRIIGGLGEAVFFGVLFLLGTITLTALVASQLLNPTPELYRPGFGFWLVVLVLASLMLIGGIGVLITVTQVGTSAERRSDMVRRAARIDLIQDAMPSPQEFPNVPRDERMTDSPGVNLEYRLPAEVQRTAFRLASMAGLSLLLSGSASVLSVLFVNSLVKGQTDWLTLAFAVPLLAVGVWSTYCFLHDIWRISRIGPTYVEISDFPLHPGRDYQVAVSQSGRFSLNSLQLLLVCEEEATYHQGTDIRVESRRVYEETIAQREQVELEPGTPLVVQATLSIPAEAAHSFQSTHNAVRWKLVVEGAPVTCPKFVRTFPAIIYPRNGKTAATVSSISIARRDPVNDSSVETRQPEHGTTDQPPNLESSSDARAR